MTFRCDPVTRAELQASGTNKLQWAAIVVAALGSNRRIRCRHTPNTASTDVWADGTEFRNVGSTGAIKTAAGKIVGLGRIKGTTVKLAADVSTGKAVLRITNSDGQRWVEGSLGVGTGYDFKANGYFTATNGLALRSDFAISGPAFLPSGTGPAAPELDADAPAKIRVLDYSADESNPTIAGTALINVRELDFVYDDKQLAAEQGDVRVMRVADGQGVVMGSGSDAFKFTAFLNVMHKGVNADNPNKPVYQLRVNAVPWGRWPSFPFKKDFVYSQDILAPRAFKVQVLRADDSILHTFEMYSSGTGPEGDGTGRPINSSWQQIYDRLNKPVQPYWTCHMTLRWDSAKTTVFSKMNHVMPQVDARSMDPTNVTGLDSSPEQWPIFTGNSLVNGLNFWQCSPKWSRKEYAGTDTDQLDPNLNYSQMSRESGQWITQLIGYGYEPGASCNHIWYMSPGGSRHDRAFWPHAATKFASDPNGVRLHGNVPMKELMRHWNLGYSNEGCHYHLPNGFERGASIDKQKVLNGLVAYQQTYYGGGNEDFVPDVANNGINLLAAPRGEGSTRVDKYNRSYTCDYQRDNQHNYSTSALAVYTLNSAADAMEARHFFNSNVLANWGFSQGTFTREEFLTRQHAWFTGQYAQMWYVASSHPQSYSRVEIEAFIVRHLHAVWDSIYPGYLNSNHVTFKFLRKMGSMMAEGGDGGAYQNSNGEWWYRGELATDHKAFYMGQPLMFMKQTGLLEVLRAKSTKCQQILDLMIVSLGKQATDCFVLGGGRLDNRVAYPGGNWYPPNIRVGDETYDPPGWASYPPPSGQIDWIRQSDGTVRSNGYPEAYNTQHFRAQYVKILMAFFPEYHAQLPNLAQANTLVDGYYDLIENDPTRQWHYRFTMMGFHQQQATIGALP